MLDNFLLYLSLKDIVLYILEDIHNQVNIKQDLGILEMIPQMTRILFWKVQPRGQKSGHIIGLLLIRVH